MASARVDVSGRFLCTKNYNKKDSAGNYTKEVVYQILVFDGDNAVKVIGVDGSGFEFGDEVSFRCDVYANEYGVAFKAVSM